MYKPWDWLRASRTGAELLATLQYLETQRDAFASQGANHFSPVLGEGDVSGSPTGTHLGPPPSALDGPCWRCWVYPRDPTTSEARYCSTCHAILEDALRLRVVAAQCIVVWGFVNQLPYAARTTVPLRDTYFVARYTHDEQHFLVMLRHRDLQPWLQELVLYHGDNLKGLLQVCPTTGGRDTHMGELLCRMAYNEARFPCDRLRIRFFAAPYYVFDPHVYERMGILTFEVAEFMRMLDMAVVFRSLLKPEEQKILRDLLNQSDPNAEQFYWGRFLGSLNNQARDMLNAWKIRQWSKPQIDLLYELTDYVGFYQTD
jgi:hypothetical protein